MSSIGPIGADDPLVVGRRTEIGLRPIEPKVPPGLPKLRGEGERNRGRMLVSGGQLWRRLGPADYHQAIALVDGVPVAATAETVASFDRRAEAEAKRVEREQANRAKWLRQNRRPPTLAESLGPNVRLPSISAAYDQVVHDYGGVVEASGDRLRIEVAPTLGSYNGQEWAKSVRVL